MAANVPRETSFNGPWLPRDVRALKRMRSRKMSVADIAQTLGRSELSVRLKISRTKGVKKRRYYCRLFELRRGQNVASS